MKIKTIIKDNDASVIPVILFALVILGAGALYSLLFIEIAFSTFDYMIPASDSKTFIMMGFYAIPLFVLVIGVFALLQSGIKKGYFGGV